MCVQPSYQDFHNLQVVTPLLRSRSRSTVCTTTCNVQFVYVLCIHKHMMVHVLCTTLAHQLQLWHVYSECLKGQCGTQMQLPSSISHVYYCAVMLYIKGGALQACTPDLMHTVLQRPGNHTHCIHSHLHIGTTSRQTFLTIGGARTSHKYTYVYILVLFFIERALQHSFAFLCQTSMDFQVVTKSENASVRRPKGLNVACGLKWFFFWFFFLFFFTVYLS